MIEPPVVWIQNVWFATIKYVTYIVAIFHIYFIEYQVTSTSSPYKQLLMCTCIHMSLLDLLETSLTEITIVFEGRQS